MVVAVAFILISMSIMRIVLDAYNAFWLMFTSVCRCHARCIIALHFCSEKRVGRVEHDLGLESIDVGGLGDVVLSTSDVVVLR